MKKSLLPSTKKDIKRILEVNKGMLRRYRVKKIGLFGSWVRNEQGRDSDIDLLIEFEEPTFDNFMGLLFDLESLFGRRVELVTVYGLSPHIAREVYGEVEWFE